MTDAAKSSEQLTGGVGTSVYCTVSAESRETVEHGSKRTEHGSSGCVLISFTRLGGVATTGSVHGGLRCTRSPRAGCSCELEGACGEAPEIRFDCFWYVAALCADASRVRLDQWRCVNSR